ncbi:MAG: M56 family metallopeptidase [Acidobacteriota bacterium]|nr:M56 family metallopeptidase [Acidobacteriota bacterium]
MSWLLVQSAVCLVFLAALALLRSAPFRIRLFLCLAAIACWFLPLHQWRLPERYTPAVFDLAVPPILQTTATAAETISVSPAFDPLQMLLSSKALFFCAGLGVLAFGLLILRHRCFLQSLTRRAERADHLWGRIDTSIQTPLYIVDGLAGALTTGIFTPRVWVGRTHANSAAVTGLLRHEWTHIRRMDNLVLLFLTLTRCLLWWNPFIHLLARRARFYIELACDHACSNKPGGENYRVQLAELLLEQAGLNPSHGVLACGAASNFNMKRLTLLERRYTMKFRHLLVLAGLCLAGPLLVAYNPANTKEKFNDARTIPFLADNTRESYSGFEINVVDVKDQPIGDLLRFIADQVGFKLKLDDPKIKDIKSTYRFRNMPWDRMVHIILKDAECAFSFDGKQLIVVTSDYAAGKGLLRKSASLNGDPPRWLYIQMQEQPPENGVTADHETVYYALNHSERSKTILKALKTELSQGGRVLTDRNGENITLIIGDKPVILKRIREVLSELDSPD